MSKILIKLAYQHSFDNSPSEVRYDALRLINKFDGDVYESERDYYAYGDIPIGLFAREIVDDSIDYPSDDALKLRLEIMSEAEIRNRVAAKIHMIPYYIPMIFENKKVKSVDDINIKSLDYYIERDKDNMPFGVGVTMLYKVREHYWYSSSIDDNRRAICFNDTPRALSPFFYLRNEFSICNYTKRISTMPSYTEFKTFLLAMSDRCLPQSEEEYYRRNMSIVSIIKDNYTWLCTNEDIEPTRVSDMSDEEIEEFINSNGYNTVFITGVVS